MVFQHRITIRTAGRGFTDITGELARALGESAARSGLCQVFLRHTSASLCLCENVDPDVRRDLEHWFARAVPDGDPGFVHGAEGPDDMPAHVRSILSGSELSVPFANGRLLLGTWQGVYLWEHRHAPHRRELVVTVLS